MASAIKLKAYLYDSRRFGLTEQEKQLYRVDLIPMITGKENGEDAWSKIGLKRASYRMKAEAMISHIKRHRNWICPYPVDGLRVLLEEGIVKGADAYEKNWCVLNLVLLLTQEKADKSQINTVLRSLQGDKDGRAFLKKEDEALWRLTEVQLKKIFVRR